MKTSPKMLKPEILKQKLAAMDGSDYAGYQSLLGSYDFNLYKLIIQQIPKDPYAPSHTGMYRIQLERRQKHSVLLEIKSKIQKIAAADFLARRFFAACQRLNKGLRGTGFSGLITINEPGQAILERNSVIITDALIEIRCFLGLPAEGRNILAAIAQSLLFEELPEIVKYALFEENFDHQALKTHIYMAEDARYLRHKLKELGLIAFVAEQAVLPRASGTSDKPLIAETPIPFLPPADLTTEIELPHTGKIKGLAIAKGVTLITGGGYHGKSTLLKTLESGIYNHIPGDGRELCVTNDRTVKIRAYSGRYVEKTDISPFIKNLPFQKDTTAFSTANSSGSTSQAASIIEAIEAGAEVLLMDEDTCATNFMIRDHKMQQLVNEKDEPITAFIDKVRQLYEEKSISTVLVLGGVGDYFDVSDQVIQMINYQPVDVTSRAHEIARLSPLKRKVEDQTYPFQNKERIPLPESIDPHNAYGKFAVHTREAHRLNFGRQVIDLNDLEQLVELSQTTALGFAIEYAKKYMDKKRTLREVTELVISDINRQGLDVISSRISGHYACFRSLELAFALNRLRGYSVVQKDMGFINT